MSRSKEELLNSLSELELYMLEVQELNDIKNRSFVLSKENGIITAVNNFSVGEIIEAGTILAELVPSETEYIVEAKLLPKDSGKLVQGQKAETEPRFIRFHRLRSHRYSSLRNSQKHYHTDQWRRVL